MRLVLQEVGDRSLEFNELCQTRLVLIGRQLTLKKIECESN
jgi:hypothetical protein